MDIWQREGGGAGRWGRGGVSESSRLLYFQESRQPGIGLNYIINKTSETATSFAEYDLLLVF